MNYFSCAFRIRYYEKKHGNLDILHTLAFFQWNTCILFYLSSVEHLFKREVRYCDTFLKRGEKMLFNAIKIQYDVHKKNQSYNHYLEN